MIQHLHDPNSQKMLLIAEETQTRAPSSISKEPTKTKIRRGTYFIERNIISALIIR